MSHQKGNVQWLAYRQLALKMNRKRPPIKAEIQHCSWHLHDLWLNLRDYTKFSPFFPTLKIQYIKRHKHYNPPSKKTKSSFDKIKPFSEGGDNSPSVDGWINSRASRANSGVNTKAVAIVINANHGPWACVILRQTDERMSKHAENLPDCCKSCCQPYYGFDNLMLPDSLLLKGN